MEIWDARDRDGKLLGVDLVRGEPVPAGMYHSFRLTRRVKASIIKLRSSRVRG